MSRFLVVASFFNNPEKDIDNTFNSVLNQTHKDWILVVGDDFSSDKQFKQLLKKKVQEVNDPRIVYYEVKKKRELYLYQNTFLHYSYDYYFDLDTDDLIHPELFRIYDTHFNSYPEVYSIFSDYNQIEEGTGNLQQWSLVQEPENWLEEWNFRHTGEFWEIYSKRNTQKVFGHARAMRRPEVKSLPILKECKTATDTYFLFYNLTRGKHLHIPRNLYTYKRRNNSDSGMLSIEEREQFNLNVEPFFKDFKNPGKVGIYDNIWHLTSAISTCDWLDEVQEFSLFSKELTELQKDKIKLLYPDKKILFNEQHENIIVAWIRQPEKDLPDYRRLSILTFNDKLDENINELVLQQQNRTVVDAVNQWTGGNGDWYYFFRQNRLTHNKTSKKVLVLSSATKDVRWNSFGKPEWVSVTKPNHQQYAEKWGFDYTNLIVDNDTVEDRHPTWVKIFQIIELIKSDKWSWIVWIDSDAVFVNEEQEINDWISGNWNWVLPKMPPDKENNKVWTKTSTGFMAIRSCKNTLEVLEEMWENPGAYRYDFFHEQSWLDEYFKELLDTNANLKNLSFEDIPDPVVFKKGNKSELLVIPYKFHLIDDSLDIPFIYHAGGNTLTKLKRIKHVLETKQNNKTYISFEYGPKVEVVGNQNKTYFIEFIDARTSKVVYSDTITNNMWTKCNREYYVPWIIKINGEIIHKLELTGKEIRISFDSKSVGDTIAWMPQVLEFKNKFNCTLTVSTFHNTWFEGLDAYRDIIFTQPDTVHTTYVHYRVGWFKTDGRWDQGSKNPIQPNTIPLIQTATDILGLPYKEINYGLNFTPKEKPIKGKYICIGPRATAGLKEWPHKNWRELAKKLYKDGYKVVNLSYEGFKGTNIINKEKLGWEDTWNYLHHADLFIGLGSGLSWTNWALSKHTLMINNFIPLGYEFSTQLTKVENSSVCNSCWVNKDFVFDAGDWDWCPVHKGTEKQHICQKSITVDQVYRKIKAILVAKESLSS